MNPNPKNALPVRQSHVPGSIETNHGSLSNTIGAFWVSRVVDIIGSDLMFSLYPRSTLALTPIR